MLYFCADSGKVFIYETKNKKAILLNIPDNVDNLPLIGSPVIINNNIFIVDIELNIYKLTI